LKHFVRSESAPGLAPRLGARKRATSGYSPPGGIQAGNINNGASGGGGGYGYLVVTTE